jgi:type IV secretory pathway VirB4 component
VVQDGLKAHRKQNAFMVFGRQSSPGVLRPELARTFLERCAIKLFPA